MYIDFPDGRLKFFGTLMFPQNKYMVLKFTSKNIVCEDILESMVSPYAWLTHSGHQPLIAALQMDFAAQVVFSEAWWIGKQKDNPEEKQLPIPQDIIEAGMKYAGVHFSLITSSGPEIGEESSPQQVIMLLLHAESKKRVDGLEANGTPGGHTEARVSISVYLSRLPCIAQFQKCAV
jgi:hypothetical protein